MPLPCWRALNRSLNKVNQTMFHRYLTHAEEKKLLSTLKAHAGLTAARDRAWIILARHTGVRVGALSRITVGDALLAIQTGDLVLRAEIQKRAQTHTVPCNVPAIEALRDLIRINASMGGDSSDPDGRLILSRRGSPLSVRGYQWALRHWAEVAGLPYASQISPHWLRHTLAKRLVERSTSAEPLRIVQQVLGHKNINTTAIYTKPDRSTIRLNLEMQA